MSLARSFDVIVIGGGAAESAAVGAANAGAQTLLVDPARSRGERHAEKCSYLLWSLYELPKKQAVFGVANQGSNGYVRWAPLGPIQFHGVAVLIEPESVKYVLDQLCKHVACRFVAHHVSFRHA